MVSPRENAPHPEFQNEERESVCVCVCVCMRGRVREKRERDKRVLVDRETVCNRVEHRRLSHRWSILTAISLDLHEL